MGRIRRKARVVALAAAGTAMTLAGGLTGAGTAVAQENQIDVQVTYECPRPTDRTWQLGLRVTATFPTRVKAGEPVQPTDVTLAVSVPPEVFAELVGAGAVSATAAVKLDTSIVQGTAAASATWGTTQEEKVPIVADGPTEFAGTTRPEPVTVGGAGDLSFTAAGMVVNLTGWTADGAATEPPSTDLTCVPVTDAALAVVRVAPTGDFELPDLDIKVGTRETAPPAGTLGVPPPECQRIPPPEGVTAFQSYCANLAGYANVNKLDVSVRQPAGLINISAGSFVPKCDGINGKFCSKNSVLPNLDGEPKLPPAPASFFALGIIPTTGTMQLTQLGLGIVDIWFQGANGLATARLQVSARLFDAKINGVPLDLGPDCRTETPIDVVLTARPGTYSITEGGVLSGKITIPPFSGCGATEDLDPLITALVSGPDNFVKMTQGKVCSLSNGVVCPPPVPIPER